MTDSLAETPERSRFRARNRLFALLTTLVLAGMALIVAVVLYGLAVMRQDGREDVARHLLIAWTPTLFYLWALWTLRGLFATLGRTGASLRGGAVAGAISKIGWALALGAGCTVFISPLILALMVRPHAMSAFAAIDVPACTLGVVGLALIALSRVLRHAAELEAETSDLKTVLGDFI
jgi:hypothetical protein